MATHVEKALAFRALHEELGAFVVPNAWDAGTARILGALGFRALATTSAGLAFALGRRDGAAAISREETLANARAIAEATDLPVSADLENGFAHEPQAAAATIRLAADAGVVGGSIEDSTGDPSAPIYDFDLAVERIAAAVAVARSMPFPFTLTARAENFLHGRRDVADTIRRLQAYEAAGADVLYAPGLSTLNDGVLEPRSDGRSARRRWCQADQRWRCPGAGGAQRLHTRRNRDQGRRHLHLYPRGCSVGTDQCAS